MWLCFRDGREFLQTFAPFFHFFLDVGVFEFGCAECCAEVWLSFSGEFDRRVCE